eukprot:gene17896-21308_t
MVVDLILQVEGCVCDVVGPGQGLFHRSIVQSGPCIVPAEAGWGPGTASFGAAVSEAVMRSVNATSLAQLREVTESELIWPPAISFNDSHWPVTSKRESEVLEGPQKGLMVGPMKWKLDGGANEMEA